MYRPATNLTPRIVWVNKAESETNIRKRCPQLPEEIWALIAAKMSTKEWVKISTTCKMFCRVSCKEKSSVSPPSFDFRLPFPVDAAKEEVTSNCYVF